MASKRDACSHNSYSGCKRAPPRQQRRHHLGQGDMSHVRGVSLVGQPRPGERLAAVIGEAGHVKGGDFLSLHQLLENFRDLRPELADLADGRRTENDDLVGLRLHAGDQFFQVGLPGGRRRFGPRPIVAAELQDHKIVRPRFVHDLLVHDLERLGRSPAAVAVLHRLDAVVAEMLAHQPREMGEVKKRNALVSLNVPRTPIRLRPGRNGVAEGDYFERPLGLGAGSRVRSKCSAP